MKKIFSLILVLIAVFSSSAVCFAQSEKENLNVYAKYSYSKGVETCTILKNKAEIKASSAIRVRVVFPSDDYDELILAVRRVDPKNEKDAFEWMKKEIPENIKLCEAFDIFIIGKDGERIELPENAEICVTLFEKIKYVYYLDYDGNCEKLESSIDSFSAIFRSSKTGYYLMCDDKIINTDTESTTQNKEEPAKPSVPDTGEKVGTLLIGTLLSSAAAIYFLKSKKNKA